MRIFAVVLHRGIQIHNTLTKSVSKCALRKVTNPLKIGIGEDEVLPDTLYYIIFDDLIGLIKAVAPVQISEDELHRKVVKNMNNFSEQSQKIVDQWLKTQTQDGMTALHQFVQSSHVKFSNGKVVASDLVIKRLLELASSNTVSDVLAAENQDGLIPFEYAKKIGYEHAEILDGWGDLSCGHNIVLLEYE